jgi:hypothetical protein
MNTKTEQKSTARRDETIPEQGINASGASHSGSQTFHNDSPKFREVILRQYEASFRTDGWLHSGLND